MKPKSPSGTVNLKLPLELEYQASLIDAPQRRKIGICGRRWGKTKCGLRCITEGHGPDKRLLGALMGAHIWWVGPTNDITDPLWYELTEALDPLIVRKKEEPRDIWLPGGGQIGVRSANNFAHLVGVGLDGVVLDEVAQIEPLAWFQHIRPMLMDTLGWALFIGTPRGMNWVYDLYQAAATRPHWYRQQSPSWENPYLTPEDIQEMKEEDIHGGAMFLQEIEAQFVTAGAGMFKEEWFRIVDVPPRGMKVARSWDLAATTEREAKDPDYTASVKLGLFKGDWYVLDAFQFRGSPAEVEKRVKETAREDGYAVPVYMEQEPGASGKAVVDHYARLLAGYTFRPIRSTGKKEQRAEPVSAAAENGHFYLVRAAWNRDYIQHFLPFPLGAHDDWVDATSLTVNALAQSFGLVQVDDDSFVEPLP